VEHKFCWPGLWMLSAALLMLVNFVYYFGVKWSNWAVEMGTRIESISCSFSDLARVKCLITL
jgi:hypothetical protein